MEPPIVFGVRVTSGNPPTYGFPLKIDFEAPQTPFCLDVEIGFEGSQTQFFTSIKPVFPSSNFCAGKALAANSSLRAPNSILRPPKLEFAGSQNRV
jgi:hypothetical protein